jgi:hypothetical protein
MSSDLWVEATHDAERETAERQLVAARESVMELWPFLSGARSDGDYQNRKALVSDRLDHAVRVAEGDLGLRVRLEESLDQDWKILFNHRVREAKQRQAALDKKKAKVKARIQREAQARARVTAETQRRAALRKKAEDDGSKWRVEFIVADGSPQVWYTNAMRYDTEGEAAAAAQAKANAWFSVTDWRVVTADTPERQPLAETGPGKWGSRQAGRRGSARGVPFGRSQGGTKTGSVYLTFWDSASGAYSGWGPFETDEEAEAQREILKGYWLGASEFIVGPKSPEEINLELYPNDVRTDQWREKLGRKTEAGSVGEGAGAVGVVYTPEGEKRYLGESGLVESLEDAKGFGFFESAEQYAWSYAAQEWGAENMGPMGGEGGDGKWNSYADNPYGHITSGPTSSLKFSNLDWESDVKTVPSPRGKGQFKITEMTAVGSGQKLYTLYYMAAEDSPFYGAWDTVKSSLDLAELEGFIQNPPDWWANPGLTGSHKTSEWAGYTLVDESKFSDEFHKRFIGYFESEAEAKAWAETEYGVPPEVWGDRVYLSAIPGNPEVTVVDGREVPFTGTKTADIAPESVGVSVGTIFVDSWGYDQTNIDFYEVTGLTGASVRVRQIGKRETSDGPTSMTGHAVPIPGNFIGPETTKRVQVSGYDGDVFIKSDYGWCEVWDGQPEAFSSYAVRKEATDQSWYVFNGNDEVVNGPFDTQAEAQSAKEAWDDAEEDLYVGIGEDYGGYVERQAKTSSTRYDTAKRVVENGQHEKLEGAILDGMTAQALVLVYEALSSKNQERFDDIPLDKLIDLAWRSVASKIARRQMVGQG